MHVIRSLTTISQASKGEEPVAANGVGWVVLVVLVVCVCGRERGGGGGNHHHNHKWRAQGSHASGIIQQQHYPGAHGLESSTSCRFSVQDPSSRRIRRRGAVVHSEQQQDENFCLCA